MNDETLETYVLHVTKECNLNCTYCYEQDKTSTYEWDDIKTLLDDIVKYNKHFGLEFLGGEPCLRIDLICKTVDYLESMSDVNVRGYTITTNGTIIDDDLIDLLKKYNKVSWTASIDGNKFMNFMRVNKDGKNSYDTVIKNFKQLHEALDGDKFEQLGCHLVTHHYNIGYYNDGIKDLYDHGFRHFGIGTIESTIPIDDQYCNEFLKQHRILSDKMHAGEYPGISIGLFNWVKPPSDQRHYIKDETGKTILETYGRAENDIKDTDKYKTNPSESAVAEKIHFIRYAVYKYHHRRKS